jgi:hypothetical protein
MQKAALLLLCFLATTITNAQLAYNVHLDEAGTLESKLTEAGNLPAITNLTITGNVDVRDFRTMRNFMQALTSVDLKVVTIKEFYGAGIYEDYHSAHAADEVPAWAFWDCSNFNNIILPSSIKSIGHSAMRNCSGLTQIEIPSSVTSIPDSAFFGCTKLSEIYISSAIKNIGTGALANCKASIVVDGANTIYSSLEGILYNKTKSTLIQCPIGKADALTIPNSVGSIDDYAFYGCEDITQISIPTSVISLGHYAFMHCTGLKHITLPSSINSIGVGSFFNCKALNSIEVGWQTPIDINPYVFDGIDLTNCTLYVPDGTKATYQNTNVWKDFSHIIEGVGF